jgi:murein DD-endopeptidase MepM/ murein hydrolase activator NlpD
MRRGVFASCALLALCVAIASPLPAASCPAKPGNSENEVSLIGAPEFTWPVKGIVVEDFCGDHRGKAADGVSIAVPKGTAVKAAADGFVQYAGKILKSYGKLILIHHDAGWVTVYAYNSVLAVRRGDKVRQGQMIGRSGRAPISGIQEVYFEVRRDAATPVDPMRLLKAQPPVPAKIKRWWNRRTHRTPRREAVAQARGRLQ